MKLRGQVSRQLFELVLGLPTGLFDLVHHRRKHSGHLCSRITARSTPRTAATSDRDSRTRSNKTLSREVTARSRGIRLGHHRAVRLKGTGPSTGIRTSGMFCCITIISQRFMGAGPGCVAACPAADLPCSHGWTGSQGIAGIAHSTHEPL